jgi:hypothetical protein
MQQEMIFVNFKITSPQVWIIVIFDTFLLIVRDANLWDDLGAFIARQFGDSCGKAIFYALAILAGDTDTLADKFFAKREETQDRVMPNRSPKQEPIDPGE